MSKKTERARRSEGPRPRTDPRSPRRRVFGLAAVAAAVALAAAAAFVAVGRPSGGDAPTKALRGESAPAFAETDVITGEPVSSATLQGKNVLLFFSEGVMCQACFQQMQALQARTAELEGRGLVLVNITPDPGDLLREAATAYEITTPLVSDEDRNMSLAYDVLGVPGAMHSDTPGHTFVLIDGDGRVRWRRDYTTMYVPPEELFAALPRLDPAA